MFKKLKINGKSKFAVVDGGNNSWSLGELGFTGRRNLYQSWIYACSTSATSPIITTDSGLRMTTDSGLRYYT